MEAALSFTGFILGLSFLLICGCGSCRNSLAQKQESPAKPPQASGAVEIICHYGPGGKNQLDTSKGTFTKDMVIEPPAVIRIVLSEAEQTEILNAAIKAGFFSMPAILSATENQKANLCIGPCRTYYLSIKAPGRSNAVTLDSCSCGEQKEEKNLAALVKVINSIIASRPEYKALPEPKAGYL